MSRLAAIVFVVLAACAGQPPGGGGPDGKGDGVGGGGGGGSGGGGGGGGGSLTPADFLTAMGKKDCDGAFACKASFPTDQGGTFEQAWGTSAAMCYVDSAQYYDPAKVQQGIAGGTIIYDGAKAKACIDGIGAPSCATYWTDGPDYPAACDSVMTGKVADGGACAIDFECASLESICDDTTHKCGAAPANRSTPADGLPLHPRRR